MSIKCHSVSLLALHYPLIRQVIQSSLESDLDAADAANMEDRRLVSAARAMYGAVSTFSALDGANRVSILPPEAGTATECKLAAGEDETDAVNAYLVKRQSASGCYHDSAASQKHGALFVVSLDSADGLPSDPEDPAPVYLSLNAVTTVSRDVRLILRSGQPVRWMLQSTNVQGRLDCTVSDGSSVHDLGLASAQTLDMAEEAILPGDFEGLWRLAAAYGASPEAFVHVDKANILSLTVPAGDEPALEEEQAEKTLLIPGTAVEEAMTRQEEAAAVKELSALVRRAMTKECSQSETVVSVRRAALERYGVVSLTLNDEGCGADQNSTHWILAAPGTSCGSVNSFSAGRPTFRNNVVLVFHPRSALGQYHVEVPFVCKFKPGLPGMGQNEDQYEEGDPFERTSDDGEEMYVMTLRHDHRGKLANKPDQATDVSVADVLSVSVAFDTRAFLSLAIERCWTTTNGRQTSTGEDAGTGDTLILAGCAGINNNVSQTSSSSFSFSVSRWHARAGHFYLHCLVGLCSPSPSLSAGNVGLVSTAPTELSHVANSCKAYYFLVSKSKNSRNQSQKNCDFCKCYFLSYFHKRMQIILLLTEKFLLISVCLMAALLQSLSV